MNHLRVSLALTATLALAACNDPATPAPTPAADAGGNGASIATLCANSRRMSCPTSAACERDVAALFGTLPLRCAGVGEAFLACAARSSATACGNIERGQFTGCEAAARDVEACANGDAGTAPADVTTASDDAMTPGDVATACGAEGAACCAGDTACRAGLNCDVATSRCAPCGAAGQLCCPSTTATCAPGLRCDGALRCSATACGEEGEPCCEADGGPQCSGVNRCESGTCHAPF